MPEVVFALVMVRIQDDHHYAKDFETWLRDTLHARFGSDAQVQYLGEETEALREMWQVRQRILERRQRDPL